jgi:mycofactocin system glycosyltransferase
VTGQTSAYAIRAAEPVPPGFRIVLDQDAREIGPGLWLGGQPLRLIRLTGSGRAAWEELSAGPVASRAGGLLARRLLDGGLAHPMPPPLATTPSVTVVIPVYDRAAELERCLAALGNRFPVIVVDDASTNAAGVQAAAARHGARLIVLASNQGPAAARNAGLAAVDTELVALLDSDTVPDNDWIAALAGHLQDPLVGAVAPRITPISPPSWAGRYDAARSPLDLGGRPAGVRPYTRVSYLPTAALLARRTALLAVARDGAVFDPALRVGEDVDLIWRLVAAGWRVRYQPEASVTHREPVGWPALLSRRYRYGTSTAALAGRHRDNVAPLIIQPWYTAAVAAALAGRPALATAALTGTLASARRAIRRAGLPGYRTASTAVDALRQTWLGLGRYATQFAAPAVLLALILGRPWRKLAAASLLAGPAVTTWLGNDRPLDPVRLTAAALADECAYGAGVLVGCLRHRTARPLIPHTARRRTPW